MDPDTLWLQLLFAWILSFMILLKPRKEEKFQFHVKIQECLRYSKAYVPDVMVCSKKEIFYSVVKTTLIRKCDVIDKSNTPARVALAI